MARVFRRVLFLFFCSSLKHFVDLLPRFNENHWDSVVKFMSGFSRSELGNKICANFPNISLSVCPSKIEYLQQIAKKCMKDYVESAMHEYPSLKETVSSFGVPQNIRRCFIQPDTILLKRMGLGISKPKFCQGICQKFSGKLDPPRIASSSRRNLFVLHFGAFLKSHENKHWDLGESNIFLRGRPEVVLEQNEINSS